MSALAVVERLDVLEDRRSRFLSRLEDTKIHEFELQGRKEALDDGVVPTIAAAAHAAGDAAHVQQILVVLAGVLAPTVRVVQQSGLRISAEQLSLP